MAAVIVARDDRSTVAATVRACRAIRGVDLIVVVDDGSVDDTGSIARSAGAAVVRHSVPRGRASALETGVKVVAMRDRADWPQRHILFLDPDLGDSAVEASTLVEAVNRHEVDCAIGVSEEDLGVPKSISAARAIRKSGGWLPQDPTAPNRCLTREAVDAIMPFSGGTAVDAAMTLDLLSQGFEVEEFSCDFHRTENPEKRRASKFQPRRTDAWLVAQADRVKRLGRFT